MKKVKVIFGHMTHFDEQIDGFNAVIVHSIQKVMMVDEDKLDDVCEDGLNDFDSYLIPEQYNFEVSYECEIPNIEE